MAKILVVDDEKHIAELISLYLVKEGYETKEVYTGKAVLTEFENFKPDLVLLDIMLPEIDGYQLCTQIRAKSDVPIIMLTAKSDVFDKVLGLDLGADDYVIKPFDSTELLARVRAVLRRGKNAPVEVLTPATVEIKFDNLIIYPNNYTVNYYGEVLEFPPKEFEVLLFFAKNPNQVFTRDKLLDKIWGYEYVGDTRTVDVHIKRIREKLNKKGDPWSIKTVWGVGYKFDVK